MAAAEGTAPCAHGDMVAARMVGGAQHETWRHRGVRAGDEPVALPADAVRGAHDLSEALALAASADRGLRIGAETGDRGRLVAGPRDRRIVGGDRHRTGAQAGAGFSRRVVLRDFGAELELRAAD